MKVLNNISGFLAGFVCFFIGTIIVHGNTSEILSTVIPVIMGGFIAGIIVKARPWISGAVMAAIVICYIYAMALFVINENNVSFMEMVSSQSVHSLLKQLLIIPSGIIGAYAGFKFKKLWQK